MDRRDFLFAATAAAMGSAFAQQAGNDTVAKQPDQFLRWTIFSRHLQCLTTQPYARELPYETGVIIGEAAASAGFSAINLTVRIDGHVEPELVEANLGPMLRGIRSTGAHCDHITSDVLTLKSNHAETVLKTAADNGVHFYRWGTFKYEHSATAYGRQFVAQLDQARRDTEVLAAYNSRLGLTALYHTYSGDRVGASLWDLVYVLEGFDPDAVGINFDIGHMFSEGVRSWVNDLRYAMPYLRGASMKDATYIANEDGKATRVFKAMGEGSVDWVEFFRQLREGGFSGPAESHLEFDFMGTNLLRSTWWKESNDFIVSGEQLIQLMSSELSEYNRYAVAAGWDKTQLI